MNIEAYSLDSLRKLVRSLQYENACTHTEWTRLEPRKIIEHLLGYREDEADVLGVYPLFPDGTCRFIVFDFDNHEKGAEKTDFANTNDEWHEEVDALRFIFH